MSFNEHQNIRSLEIIDSLTIHSSYAINGLGRSLYNIVLKIQPLESVEFGSLHGYSAICIGLALKTLGRGRLTCYDLWDKYEFKHGHIDDVKCLIKKYDLEDFIDLKFGNLLNDNWEKLDFDFCHIDISNDGDKILKISSLFSKKIKKGVPILFEGGTLERDQVDWMKKYNKVPITSLKTQISYEVLVNKFPGLSIFSECLEENFLKKLRDHDDC